MLVKSVDLSSYPISTTLKHQYNKKANLQTRLDYDPVTITSSQMTTMDKQQLCGKSSRYYYYKDGSYAKLDGSSTIPLIHMVLIPRGNTYAQDTRNIYRYGFDNDSDKHFFRSIQIYPNVLRHRYTCFTLVQPSLVNGHMTQWKMLS